MNSTFIAMCVMVCKQYFFDYVVAPSEADMQVGRRNKSSLSVCRDSDLIAYGNKRTVIVDSYAHEKFRFIDMNTPLTDEVTANCPLYAYYCKCGLRIIHWWGAVMGYDLSEEESGIMNAGKGAFMSALGSFDSDALPSIQASEFAEALWQASDVRVQSNYSVRQITDELDRISKWFSTDGTFYDDNANIVSLAGDKVKDADWTCEAFTTAQQKDIDSVQSHNLLHNSEANRGKIEGLSLPEGKTALDECTVQELKTMVVARGGGVTGKDGKPLRKDRLQKIMQAYLSLEKENPKHTVYFDRSRRNNGIFAKIDTSERRSIPHILDSLVKCGEYEPSLHQFFVDVQAIHTNGEFIDDFVTITLEAPDMPSDFIYKAFAHVGNSKNQKNIEDGLMKVLETDAVLYHAVAWAPDRKSFYIISKQRASQNRDEKTRHNTAVGEKPKLIEYLVMAQLWVVPTTADPEGHTLGKFTHVMRSRTVLPAKLDVECVTTGQVYFGCNICIGARVGLHQCQPLRAGVLGFLEAAKWFPGHAQMICQIPRSNEEAQMKLDKGKKRNMHEGISARYDIYSRDAWKYEKLNDPNFGSFDRMQSLFDSLEEDQVDEDSDGDN
ncbi:hypothetical protein ACHAXR_008074 [Thalassiosira sp. AJA248-18]